jgi:methylmalonyl-CoA/ethylmalonyl-CoA epimerase
MHLAQVAQRAQDLDRAVDFYATHLGGHLLARFDPPGLAFFDCGGVRLLLDRAAPSALLYFGVDDVREKAAQLRRAGVVIDTEPHVIFTDEDGTFGPPGEQEWMAFFRDSEANLVGLRSRHRPD